MILAIFVQAVILHGEALYDLYYARFKEIFTWN